MAYGRWVGRTPGLTATPRPGTTTSVLASWPDSVALVDTVEGLPDRSAMQAGDGRPDCTFGVLGSLTVTVDRSPVTLGAAKTRILLASLLLRRGAVVPIDELVDRLWDE